MQYILVVPEDKASSSIGGSPKLKRIYQIREINGKVLGTITEHLASKIILSFEDYLGNKLGEIRYIKIGLFKYKTSIYDSLNELRGELTAGVPDWKTKTYPAHTLEDALGHRIAITDPFRFIAPFGHTVCVFENLRNDGLKIRDPDGNIVATLKAGSTFNAIQIDLLSPSIDRLLILCLITYVIWMEPYVPSRK